MLESGEKSHTLGTGWAVREVDHLLSRLGRYTWFVLFGKWGLVVFAVLIIGFVMAWPYINRKHEGMRISFLASSTPVAQQHPGAPPVMASPVYDGINAKGQPFKVTGSQAIQKAPGEMVILNMHANLTRSDTSWVKLDADTADYFQDKHFLHLEGHVTVVDQGGYTFTTDAADVDTKDTHVIGHGPVNGVGPAGTIVATGFEIMDNGQHIRFGDKDRVSVHLNKGGK